jgi:hypothetical protein
MMWATKTHVNRRFRSVDWESDGVWDDLRAQRGWRDPMD